MPFIRQLVVILPGLHRLLMLLTLIVVALGSGPVLAAEKPNILWITSEDHGPQMGCYGDRLARTPHVDALAARGMLFRHAWSNAPVCAPARTTLITGMLATSLGAEHMRSQVALPAGMKLLPEHLRELGYYCTNNSKEDYNLITPEKIWDESSGKAHWQKRPAGKPFFAVFNSSASHEGKLRPRGEPPVTDPAGVRVPAYHPDTPEVRRDWAQYYDQVSAADAEAGKRMAELEAAGLADDTILFYFADHGPGLPRSKRWPSNSGLQVPLVVFFPPKWRHLAPREYAPGGETDRLVSFVDFAPTLLSIAGSETPATMQGKAFAGPFQTEPQPFVYGFRGRMDERYDLVRSVTDGRYVYLRNFMPHRSQGQHVNTQFLLPTTQVWRRLFEAGNTTAAQTIFWQEPKAPEELYDLQTDPDETVNLAGSPGHKEILLRLRQAQQTAAADFRDTGYLTEAEVHARSGEIAPRTALASDSAYPLARIFAAAELATRPESGSPEQVRQLFHDSDSGVRCWGAVGALVRGAAGVEAYRNELRESLADPSPSVRIPAAEAMVRYGDAAAAAAGLATLAECADPTRSSAYAGILAMNAIDVLGERAAPLVEFIRTMPTRDPHAVARANGYVERLRKKILKEEPEDAQSGPTPRESAPQPTE